MSAFSDKICYQNEITFRNAEEGFYRATLPSIPLQYLKEENGTIYAEYDYIRIELLELIDQNGIEIPVGNHAPNVFCPLDHLEVILGRERSYVEKWGRVFNLQFIEMAITEELVRIHAWRFNQSIFVRKLTALLQKRWVGRLLFWRKNIINAKLLYKELEEHVKTYKAHRVRH